LVPPALLTLVVFTLCVDVLHWDEWIIWGEILDKLRQGTFGAADLIAQHNEHRNLALRLFGFLMLPFFKLNRFAEYGLNILLAGGLFLAAARLYIRTTGERTPACVRLVFSMFAFSLLQWETFTIGFNTALLVVVLGIWLGVLVVSGGLLTMPRLLSLGLIGVIPSFTFANGVFYWVCLAPLIAFQGAANKRAVRSLAMWGAMTILVWTAYFWGFEAPGHHPSILNGFRHPLQLGGYFFGYLGGGVTSDRNLVELAIVVGFSSLILFLSLAWTEWKAGGGRRENLLPWLGVASFSILSAGVTSLARCGFGVGQAVESRYATFTSPYWMALFALLFMAWGREGATARVTTYTKQIAAAFAAVFLLSTVLCVIVVFNRHDRFVRSRNALFSLADEPALQTLFPDTAYIMMKLPLFLDKRLIVYRDIKRFSEYSVIGDPAGTFAVVGEHRAAEGRVPGVIVAGNVDAKSLHENATVLLVSGNRVVAMLPVSPSSGEKWRLFLPANNLSEGAGSLKAYLILDDGQSLRPLNPIQGVPIDPGSPVVPEYHWDQHFFVK
jgi:hypothetical protein